MTDSPTARRRRLRRAHDDLLHEGLPEKDRRRPLRGQGVPSSPVFDENPYRDCSILKGSGSSYRNLWKILFNADLGLRQPAVHRLRRAVEQAKRTLSATLLGIRTLGTCFWAPTIHSFLWKIILDGAQAKRFWGACMATTTSPKN
jgi:hypothetical protein